MLKVDFLSCNPFQENTYLVYDDQSREAAIIDPGCMTPQEKEELSELITKLNIKPVALLNTHCHMDHIYGNAWSAKQYGLKLQAEAREQLTLDTLHDVTAVLGLPQPDIQEIDIFIKDGDTIQIGDGTLEVIFTPGHTPGHVVFYAPAEGFLIDGDVLFRDSIGRMDLPNASMEDMMLSIQRLYMLPEDTIVYPGHGPSTTIGHEKRHNPFVRSEV